MSTSSKTSGIEMPFPLVWTIGFAGKRMLSPQQEQNLAAAISQVLRFLVEQAARQNARLTSISSIARGADVIFAEASLGIGANGSEVVPWKCLVPFAVEKFLDLDLPPSPEFTPHELQDLLDRRSRAEACIEESYPGRPINTCEDPSFDADDQTARDVAYLECGYRIVDEADVMIFAITAAEYEAVARAKKEWEESMAARKRHCGLEAPIQELLDFLPALLCKAGTMAGARYALAANRPTIFLNVNDPQAWDHAVIIGPPEGESLFCGPQVTPVIKEAMDECRECWPSDGGREMLVCLIDCLDKKAVKLQRQTQGGLKRVLNLHLAASTIAALSATIFLFDSEAWDAFHSWRPWGYITMGALVLLALAKPALAAAAWIIEDRLHHRKSRQAWAQYRMLAEVFRGALCRWDLPLQPLHAMDEEDFPQIKRLIRSLRLLRELTPPSPAPPVKPEPDETQAEAEFRVACETYARDRLLDQAKHFREKYALAEKEEHRWHRIFSGSLAVAIAAGLVLSYAKLAHVFHWPVWHASSPVTDLSAWLAAAAIVAPFLASYALGQITIRDCRRRVSRYKKMSAYLISLARTLNTCRANGSRLRIIEQAERMLIEEHHEWISVTRNYSV